MLPIIILLMGIAIVTPFLVRYYKRYIKNYRATMLYECKEGYKSILSRIISSGSQEQLEKVEAEIKEWDDFYTQRVDYGEFTIMRSNLIARHFKKQLNCAKRA
jgi:hypothetical protein